MTRKTTLICGLGLLFGLTLLPSAQEVQSRPTPAIPFEILGPQLIAWSQMQKPQPIPQPLPGSDRPEPSPNQKPTQSANSLEQRDSATPTTSGQYSKDQNVMHSVSGRQ
jgi:hypothetical protein